MAISWSCTSILIVGLAGLVQTACMRQVTRIEACSLPPVDTRRDLEIGNRVPGDFQDVEVPYILLLHDCAGCGTDVQMLRAAEREFGRKQVAVFFPKGVLPQYGEAGWAEFAAYSVGPDYRPMLLKVSEGKVVDLERRSQFFGRLK